jgi:hypothetical protein
MMFFLQQILSYENTLSTDIIILLILLWFMIYKLLYRIQLSTSDKKKEGVTGGP